MVNVEFEQENNLSVFQSRKILGDPTTPAMFRFLEKMGVIKTDRQAYMFLMITAVTFFVIAVFVMIYFVFGHGTRASAPQLKVLDGIIKFDTPAKS